MGIVAPIPIARELVPEETPAQAESAAVADGLTVLNERVLRGLPHVMTLDATRSLVLVLPTGLARTWRDADPAAVISDSDDQLVPDEGPSEPVGLRFDMGRVSDEAAPYARAHDGAGVVDLTGAVPRIYVREGSALAGVVPLAAHTRRITSSAAGRIELRLLRWRLHAGVMVGGGDFGSFVQLAWRPVDRAVAHFSTPALKPRVLSRLKPADKVESVVPRPFIARVREFLLVRRVSLSLEYAVPHEFAPNAPRMSSTIRGVRR